MEAVGQFEGRASLYVIESCAATGELSLVAATKLSDQSRVAEQVKIGHSLA
jgi:hypothetical protein